MTTDFTFWGHNCFLIETAGEALLIDPWLNDTGALLAEIQSLIGFFGDNSGGVATFSWNSKRWAA